MQENNHFIKLTLACPKKAFNAAKSLKPLFGGPHYTARIESLQLPLLPERKCTNRIRCLLQRVDQRVREPWEKREATVRRKATV